MQKTLIALAVAGLMSSAAFAETSVTIGGSFDAAYKFTHGSNADTADGTSKGSVTKATLGDDGAKTSRITVQAKEDLAPGWSAMVDLDLRFGTIEEGKNAATTGGLNSNDKKALYLISPFGTLRWGVMNIASEQYWDYEEKPYMVNLKDLDIVKWGISEKRDTYLTNRATEFDTPLLSLGQVKTRLKGTYAFGDSRKAGSNDVDSKSSGDVYSVANTGTVGKWANWQLSTSHRVANVETGSTGSNGGMHFSENYVNFHPIDGLKIGFQYNVFKGAGDTNSDNGLFKEKNTNIVVAYNFGQRVQIGVSRSHLNDLSTNRNSGKAWQIGGTYFLSKSTYAYLAFEKDDYASNVTGVKGGFDGTAANFVGSFDKVDQKYTTFGLVKEF